MNYDPNTGQPINNVQEPVVPQQVVQQQVVQQQVVQQPVEPVKKDNTTKIIVIIIAVVLVFILGVVGVIMYLTSFAVNDVMDDTKVNAFVLYSSKVINDTQTKYIYDSNVGSAYTPGVYVYDISTDLDSAPAANYKGYVVVDSTNPEKTEYYLDLHDNEYAIVNYQYNNTVDKSAVVKYTQEIEEKNFKSPKTVCENVKKNSSDKCLTRQGYILK